VATAYSDSVPVLFLPLGHPRNRAQVFPFFSSFRAYAPVTKWIEEVNLASQVSDVMRRAFNLLKMGRPGPVMVEIPADVAMDEVGGSALTYKPVKPTCAGANPQEVAGAAEVLAKAECPVILAGQGVLYAGASKELVELAELLEAPIMTTLEGKSVFPENHPLSLGTGAHVTTGPVVHFLRKADAVLAIGCSLTRHGTAINIPPGKIIIHATNDERDINKDYSTDYPILGDARLVLQQFIEAFDDKLGRTKRHGDGSIREEVRRVKEEWLREWMPKLTSRKAPIDPYRVIWEFMRTVDPAEAIVTHDSGGPRFQLVPFYQAVLPRGYIGWGKSHALGTSLGLIMGAKLAAPDKFCVNFMGDAAFGMTGLDFETAVRCGIPITTIVLKNSTMSSEKDSMPIANERFRARDLGGNYAEMGQAMGGYAEHIEDPEEVAPAIRRARKVNEDGRPALLEFITGEERASSHPDPF
jgi:acetolactate synthase-1/2/3 large subunit